MTTPRTPYAPERPGFACPALLALSGRAALGGARETLLGAVMAVRLVSGIRRPFPLAEEVRAARAEAARQWLTALTLPARARTAFQRVFATTASGDLASAADALAGVIEVTESSLDRPARGELVRLVTVLRAEASQLAGVPARPVE